eukprot:gene7858-8670_t
MRRNITTGSLGSTLSTHLSLPDLPNLPGVRRDISLINPKLYHEFKASRSSEFLPLSPQQEESSLEENSLASYFEENGSRVSQLLTPFPSNSTAFNDLSGRYSLVSQRRDRVLKTGSLPYSSTDSLPLFVKEGARVCRFLAVVRDQARLRRVEIKFFVEDGTIEVGEPRIENSGAVQGKLLKRHRISKPSSSSSFSSADLQSGSNSGTPQGYYGLNDFRAGGEVVFYKFVYTILDCDNATKKYLSEQGINFGAPIALPQEARDPPRGFTSSSSRSTTSRSRAGPRRKNGFYDYDRAVLRFFGVWDSREALFGDLIKVKVHYTLADDMVEVVSLPSGPNHTAATLLKKTYATVRDRPMSHPDARQVSTPMIGASRQPPEATENVRPLHWSDLRLGETVALASLRVRLIDADAFTREFFASKGQPLPQAEVEEQEGEERSFFLDSHAMEEMSRLETASNAGGDDGQSSASAMKDGMKAKIFQGMVLRFQAKLHNPTEADKSREFVIQVHLEDDTFQIREPPLRNSGHKGGIFLSRCKLDSQTGPGEAPLQPADLYIGAIVKLQCHCFEILLCDQYTFKYMEDNCRLWPFSDLSQVFQKISSRKEVLTRILLLAPGLSSKVVGAEELEELIQRANVPLVKQEVYTFFRAIDTTYAGVVKLTKVLKYVMELQQ